MVVTNWLHLLRNRFAWHQWHRRHIRRRKQPLALPSAAEFLEDRTLLDGIAFSVSGPSTVTEDTGDGDNNEAAYTVSYTGSPASGETVSVDMAHVLDETSSGDFTSDLATAIATAAAAEEYVTFDGTTLSFENIGSGSSSAFAGTATQGSSGDESWTNIANATGNSPSTHASVELHRNDFSDPLRLTNFNLGIPSGATIDGIEVELVTTGSDEPDNTPGIRLTKNGTTPVGTLTSSSGSWSSGVSWRVGPPTFGTRRGRRPKLIRQASGLSSSLRGTRAVMNTMSTRLKSRSTTPAPAAVRPVSTLHWELPPVHHLRVTRITLSSSVIPAAAAQATPHLAPHPWRRRLSTIHPATGYWKRQASS